MRATKPVTVCPHLDTRFTYIVIEADKGLVFCMFKSSEQAQILHDCVQGLDGRLDFLPSISPSRDLDDFKAGKNVKCKQLPQSL
ncbi:hypothetical protein LCGC14_1638390 [marine sediment metagenome]|uniref:Uncharacterized protein n=1 Tax=marine sediment metagenome TaxID=412755 RepID=A0A0F9I0X7_9ZZZZ